MTLQIITLSIMAGIILFVAHQSIVSLIWSLRNPGEAIQPGYHCPACHLLGSECECPCPSRYHEQCQKCGMWIEVSKYTQLVDDWRCDGVSVNDLILDGYVPCGEFWIDATLIDCPAGNDHKLN